MKSRIVTLVVCIFISPFFISTQGILAGDTTASGVVYMDIPNVSIAASYPDGYESYSLDVDEDGTAGLVFSSDVTSTMGSEIEVSKCTGIGQNRIGCFEATPTWVNSYNLMDNINSANCWNNGGILNAYYSFPDTSYSSGVFSSGYIGFRFMLNNQLSYGWVRVHATSGSITIFDFAYQGIETGIYGQAFTEKISICPNPVTDILIIDISQIQKTSNYRIMF